MMKHAEIHIMLKAFYINQTVNRLIVREEDSWKWQNNSC